MSRLAPFSNIGECSIDLLREYFSYDPDTGDIRWRIKRKRANAGDIAGCVDSLGYRRIGVDGKRYFAHRIAWAMTYGEWPVGLIDHDNRIKDDNWIENLRDVTNQENLKNAKLRITNTSGTTGVRWAKHAKKWWAYININGKMTHIGYFYNWSDAVRARKAAECRHGFHPNHGRAL